MLPTLLLAGNFAMATGADTVGELLVATIAGLSGSVWALILILAFVLVWGCVIGVRMASWKTSRQTARSRKIGAAGERRGIKMLRKAGYRILEHQPSGRAKVRIDDQPQCFRVRADALVKRDGMVFVVELKGGEMVSTLRHRHTRRQLLEYSLAFDVDGVLLVDAYAGNIHTVEFMCADGLPVATRARDFDEAYEDDDEYETDEDETEDDSELDENAGDESEEDEPAPERRRNPDRRRRERRRAS